jgi:hypothetical protein
MPEPNSNGPAFTVHVSKKIGDSIREIHKRAKHQGRGHEVIAAIEEILQRLRTNPNNLGEPLYRLAALNLEVRTCVVRPINVDFAVHRERFLVFIKGVKLLTEVGK